MISAIIALIIALGLIGGMLAFMRAKMASTNSDNREEIVARLKEANAKLVEFTKHVSSYASKGQLTTLEKLLREVRGDLEREKTALKETEAKLDAAQVGVEQKEALQQELKTSRQEDEEKLEKLLSNYSQMSSESVELEQKLAASLKSIDTMLDQLELNEDQRAVIGELSKALTSAGSLLRDLITEHSAINERLNMLRQQHEDLETEYTRLVEQQLGE